MVTLEQSLLIDVGLLIARRIIAFLWEKKKIGPNFLNNVSKGNDSYSCSGEIEISCERERRTFFTFMKAIHRIFFDKRKQMDKMAHFIIYIFG